jgi:hypothetical protein
LTNRSTNDRFWNGPQGPLCGLCCRSLQARNWIGVKANTDTKGGEPTFAAVAKILEELGHSMAVSYNA